MRGIRSDTIMDTLTGVDFNAVGDADSTPPFNIWSDVTPLGAIRTFADMNAFQLIDYFTANLMMPIGAILMALFVGWYIKPDELTADLSFGSAAMFKSWLWMIRVIVPLAIFGVLLSSV